MTNRRKLFIAVAVILILGVVAVAFIYDRFRSDPTELSKRNGDIAFVSDEAGNWDVFVLDADDNFHNLTASSEGHDFFFNFTFEGDKLNLFSTASGEFTPAIVNVDGTGFRTMSFMEAGAEVFTSGQVDVDPRWSPDGAKILWSSFRDFNPELYLSNADGSESERLTDDGGSDLMMSWSPDGSRALFISDRTGTQDVYILDFASGDVTRIGAEDGWDYQPVWSLDSKQILFVSDRDGSLMEGRFDIYVIDAETLEEHAFADDEIFKGAPTYSPDGALVAYMSNESGSWQIYVMDADGSDVRQLTKGDGNHLFPSWRPIPLENAANT